MASDGKLHLPTNARPAATRLPSLTVHRQNTRDRRASIQVKVPAEIIATQHIYRHAPSGSLVYYECCHPEIAALVFKPGYVIASDGTRLNLEGNELEAIRLMLKLWGR